MNEPAAKASKSCQWSECMDDFWETECGDEFTVMGGDTPNENGMVFCCYCGKKIKQVRMP